MLTARVEERLLQGISVEDLWLLEALSSDAIRDAGLLQVVHRRYTRVRRVLLATLARLLE